MDIKNLLDNQPLRYKLFINYFAVFMVSLLSGSLVVYFLMRNTIEQNIENELKNSTTTILNMVRTSATVSVKNYLRGIVEKNRDIVVHYYNLYQQGLLSEEAAKRQASEILLSQKIGKSGYIYCIGSTGILAVHPQKALRGVNISQYAFAQEQKQRKEGYLEYDWKNPGEQRTRPKALHMTYFAPWDWIISASSYRDEFSELINVDDFRDSILSLRFGRTGYPYVIKTDGVLVIHPKLEGANIIAEKDASGREFIREISERRNGKIIYPWQNPGETSPRKKLVIFNYIPEFDWIVASSSYLNEFYAPLETFRILTFVGVFLSLILFLAITLRISASITNPLLELKRKFDIGATGDFSVRMNRPVQDEIGQVAAYFNTFMAKLEAYSTDLKREFKERQQAEEALRASEEMFSKAFLSSPNGLYILSLKDLHFINVNDSLMQITGYPRDELIGRSLTDLEGFPSRDEVDILQEDLDRKHDIRNLPITFLTRNREARTGVLSAEIIELWGQLCILATVADVTESQRLEKEIMDISEKERLRIGQDLHDDLCPHLIGIEALGKVLVGKLQANEVYEAVLAEKIRHLVREAIDKTRSLSRGLCPVNLAAHGLQSSLEDLARNVSDVFDIACRFECTCPVVFHDNAVATHLYYIIHEAVHNAVKHGRAGNITIHFSRQDGKYRLAVIDDGIGIPDVSRAKGIGLRIMGLRSKKIGADLEIQKDGDAGTRVSVKFNKKIELMEAAAL